MQTKLLLTVLLLSLAGCKSISPSVQIQLGKIQTEQPGYFLSEWTKALETFKSEVQSSSSDVKR